MTSSSNQFQLGRLQRYALVFFALIMAICLFIFRGGLDQQKSLDFLARRSLDPQIALSNGKPTLFEFYADWCEVCKEMAPMMVSIENKYNDKVNFVMLNVENPQWNDFLDIYNVNGIPQFNFFNKDGQPKGQAIGAKTEVQIINLLELLIKNGEIKDSMILSKNGKISSLQTNYQEPQNVENSINPRSHS